MVLVQMQVQDAIGSTEFNYPAYSVQQVEEAFAQDWYERGLCDEPYPLS